MNIFNSRINRSRIINLDAVAKEISSLFRIQLEGKKKTYWPKTPTYLDSFCFTEQLSSLILWQRTAATSRIHHFKCVSLELGFGHTSNFSAQFIVDFSFVFGISKSERSTLHLLLLRAHSVGLGYLLNQDIGDTWMVSKRTYVKILWIIRSYICSVLPYFKWANA